MSTPTAQRPTWTQMTSQQQFDTVRSMEAYGGGFVRSLAAAWYRADSNNARRLAQAFPEIVAQYAPGAPFHVSSASEALV